MNLSTVASAVDGRVVGDEFVRVVLECVLRVVHKGELTLSDPYHVARRQPAIAGDRFSVEVGPVATFQIAELPTLTRMKHFRMVATAAFVFDYNQVRRSATDSRGPPGNQADEVGPFRPDTYDKVGV